jgi:hypothetical protein
VRLNGAYQPLPDSGVLFRNDLPLVLFRSLEGNRLPNNRVELEFVPASGSFLPVNFLIYRLEAANGVQAKGKLGAKK